METRGVQKKSSYKLMSHNNWQDICFHLHRKTIPMSRKR